jgi:hypothetical protein
MKQMYLQRKYLLQEIIIMYSVISNDVPKISPMYISVLYIFFTAFKCMQFKFDLSYIMYNDP